MFPMTLLLGTKASFGRCPCGQVALEAQEYLPIVCSLGWVKLFPSLPCKSPERQPEEPG